MCGRKIHSFHVKFLVDRVSTHYYWTHPLPINACVAEIDLWRHKYMEVKGKYMLRMILWNLGQLKIHCCWISVECGEIVNSVREQWIKPNRSSRHLWVSIRNFSNRILSITCRRFSKKAIGNCQRQLLYMKTMYYVCKHYSKKYQPLLDVWTEMSSSVIGRTYFELCVLENGMRIF